MDHAYQLKSKLWDRLYLVPQSLSTVVGSVQNLVGGQAGKMVEFATDALEPAAATLEQQQQPLSIHVRVTRK